MLARSIFILFPNVLVCHNKPLITTTGNEPLRHIPFQRWDDRRAGKCQPSLFWHRSITAMMRLKAIGGYLLAQTAAQKAMERLPRSLAEQR